VRRYRGNKPSPAAVKRIRGGSLPRWSPFEEPTEAVIRRLNPVIRGWAAYYRIAVSKEVFATLDHQLWRDTYRWVFGDRDSGIYLRRFVWTKIVRHRMVMGAASPDDPALDQYWAAAPHLVLAAGRA